MGGAVGGHVSGRGGGAAGEPLTDTRDKIIPLNSQSLGGNEADLEWRDVSIIRDAQKVG